MSASPSRNERLRACALSVLAVFALACATETRVSSQWLSPVYDGGPMHDFLVVAAAETPLVRRTYEDQLAAALRAAGAEAVPSYQLLPGSERLSREELEGVVREKGFDGVLVSRLLDVKEETTVVPPSTEIVPRVRYGYGYYGYYGTSYDVVHRPGYTRTTEIVRLETKLWNGADGEIAWGVISETFDAKSTDDGIRSVTRKLVKQLEKDGLLAK